MNLKIKKISPEQYYSVRQAVKFFPWVKTEQTFRDIMNENIKHDNNQLFKAIAIQRGKQKRYLIKGQNILNVLKLAEEGKLFICQKNK